METFKTNRELLKSNFPQLSSIETHEKQKLDQPLLQKDYDRDDTLIDLPEVVEDVIKKPHVYSCLKDRRSLRTYIEEEMTLDELAYLLWATQGVDKVVGKTRKATFRPVASGGARHPFETYLVINRVEGIEKGLYRYLPLSHQLLKVSTEDLSDKIVEANMGQKFLKDAAVVFIWSCIPYRGEWRYDVAAHKLMLIDAGHLCQNLYIACESIHYGTCAVAAYEQKMMDKLIGVDGQEEFVVYLAPVGKKE